MNERESATLRIRPEQLRSTPSARVQDDRLVAQLSSPGLGSTSYVVAPRSGPAPDWIVLDYTSGDHERAWRRSCPRADGVLSYTLVEDDSSSGYVSGAASPSSRSRR